MDIKALEYALAVAEMGSFTRAAEKVYVAQSSLSRKISALEKELNVELFSRSGHGVELTEAGKVFYRDAKRIIADCDILRQEIRREESKANKLRLVYSTDGSIPYVAAAVQKMKAQNPYAEIETISISQLIKEKGTDFKELQPLREDICDAIFTFAPILRCEREDWLQYRVVEKGGLCAFLCAGHPLAAANSVTAKELREMRLVMPPRKFDERLTNAMHDAIGQPKDVIYSENSPDFRVRVISGECVGIMPYSSRTLATDFLIACPIRDIREGFDLLVAWKRGNRNKALGEFIRLL